MSTADIKRRYDYLVSFIRRVAFLLVRAIAHLVLPSRRLTHSELRRFSQAVSGSVLEIGSGPPHRGRYPYSARDLFNHCDFQTSDINPSYGHQVLDVTKADLSGFDAIICTHVLEHVYEVHQAVENIRRGLAAGGRAIIIVPAFYPLHDEPHDYWRFTEHSMRRLFENFDSCEVRWRGWLRQLPTIYSVEVSTDPPAES